MRYVAAMLLAGVIGMGAAPVWGDAPPHKPAHDDLVLWYTRSAKDWNEALPVGNGRLGAMVFGGAAAERLQFNEDTLWTGRPHDYAHDGAAKYLPAVRKLLTEGKQKEAQSLAMEHMMSVPLRLAMYQPFGDVGLAFPGHDKPEGYRRSLDIDGAVAEVRYRVGGVTFTRQVFSSGPDDCIVVRITADKPGAVTFTAAMTSPHKGAAVTAEKGKAGPQTIVLKGQLTGGHNPRIRKGQLKSVLKYEAQLRVRTKGGTCAEADGKVAVTGADCAELILVAATSFKNYKDVTADPHARCEKAMAGAAARTWGELYERHVADHRKLFRRFAIDLGTSDAAKQSTDVRVKNSAKQDDPSLAALYMQFGRYLLIASSRPGCQPANLQGIWNDKLSPPWGSKWTSNINLEMNYWSAEPLNLSECTEPLFDLIDGLVDRGHVVAKKHYNCRGWVFHHNADLWRAAAPVNASNHGIWVPGGAWLCRHLWDHWLFTGDRDFLAKRAYPAMKGAAEFFVDFLVEDPKTGWLISGPSNSPEQGGLVMGPTMDHQIVRELFTHCIQASEELGVDEAFRTKLQGMVKRIAPNQIGRYGQLQEWLTDVDNPKNHHRHISHMYALHPGYGITPQETPKLAAACATTLRQRGDRSTGWSMGWKVNCWARLKDGDHSYDLFRNHLIAYGTYPNLFDRHPPFQIDGNFGAACGVAQWFVQSQGPALGKAGPRRIEILPALPKALPAGHVKGLCARGGIEIELTWTGGKATEATLTCRLACTIHLVAPKGQRITKVTRGGSEVALQAAQGGVLLKTGPGAVYHVSFK